MKSEIICGESLEMLSTMESESIDMAITSPPYWGLRDYGTDQLIFGGDADCEHEWNLSLIEHDSLRYRGHKANVGSNKNPEIHPGKEKSGGQFCSCGAWKGQLGLEPTPELYIEHMATIFRELKRVLKKEGTFWLNIGDTYGGSCQGGGDGGLSKERYRKELLTHIDKPQKKLMPKCMLMIPERLAWRMIEDGWILRNKIVWYKPNAMPSSVKDRLSNKWEYLFMFSKVRKYHFDLDAVREDHIRGGARVVGRGQSDANPNDNRTGRKHKGESNPLGKNPGDHWEINTQAFPEAHFAVFPERLCERPIKAGCPKDGIVLDPFCGAGTAGVVAKKLGRQFIGIDLKPEYCEMAKKRIAKVGYQKELF